MQSLAPTPTTVNSAPPVLTSTTHIPYLWGVEDAQAGLPCVPEMQWANRIQQVAYCIGYQRINGDSDTTRQFLGGNR